MDQSHSPVREWLSRIDDTPEPDAQPSRKRKRGDRSASVGLSGPSAVPASPSPRPSRSTLTAAEVHIPDRAPSITSEDRRTDALHLARAIGPRMAHFTGTSPVCPPLLTKTVIDISGILNVRPLFWPELQAEVSQHPLKDSLTLNSLSNPVWYPQPGASFCPAGPSPTCSQLLDIAEEAKRSETDGAGIARWDAIVHYPLIHLALSSTNPGLYTTNCTAASIIPEYQDPEKPLLPWNYGKADLAITIDQHLNRHPAIYVALSSSKSINHSDHPSSHPIAISVVTKTSWSHQPEAELDMGTWMAAHFARLHSLVVQHWPDDLWQQAISELDFLPGIIVLGHTWYFVAGTWTPPSQRDPHNDHGRRSVTLWRNINIGTTDTPEGICMIICVLRYLGAWAERVYWPWFRHWALGDVDDRKKKEMDDWYYNCPEDMGDGGESYYEGSLPSVD